MMIFLSSVLYLICCVVSYGNTLAWSNTKYGFFKINWVFQIMSSILGPISLFVSMVVLGCYKLQFKPLTKEQRWELYKENFPSLADYKGFEGFER